MRIVFVDTETSGLDPINSGPHEIAILIYDGANLIADTVFYLNPLDDEVLIHPGALEVSGVTEEQVRSYPLASLVVPQIAAFLSGFCPPEKFVFAAYNAPFDFGHIKSIFSRHGVDIYDYFSWQMIDILQLVKNAKYSGQLKIEGDNKLGTITKALDIPHENQHSALGDIVATRKVFEIIQHLTRRKEK